MRRARWLSRRASKEKQALLLKSCGATFLVPGSQRDIEIMVAVPGYLIFTVCIYDGIDDMRNGDLVADAIKNNGVWEGGTSHLLQKLLKEQFDDTVFLDVGANLGFHALYAAKLTNKVWAVEPQEKNLNKVRNDFISSKL